MSACVSYKKKYRERESKRQGTQPSAEDRQTSSANSKEHLTLSGSLDRVRRKAAHGVKEPPMKKQSDL